MTELDRLWTACADALRQQVSEATYRTWFDSVVPVDLDADRLVLAVPNPLVRNQLETRYLALITDTIADTVGIACKVVIEVRLGLDDRGPMGVPDDEEEEEEEDEVVAPIARIATPPDPDAPALSPRYTFDAFVTGSSNRFAHAATLSVAERPANSWNPLFIYGGPGLGKTHLLHAIGHFVRENYPSYRLRYASAESFTNEFIDSLRTNTQNTFKRRYRECDVLLIDDIQFMEGKESTKEEFFHTFNALHGASRQIVITSDRPPKSLADLEERLRSRFEWGLVTDVQPPELETRLAILRKKAEREPVPVPDEVLEFIATNVKDNIRILEGALIRVTAFASLNHQALDEDLAKQVLADLFSAGQPQQITPRVILDATSNTFGFNIDELCGPNRRRPLVTARQIAMYVMREMTDFSYPAIAREFGGRDHTTVIHAVEKIGNQMKERRAIYDQVTELMAAIKRGTSR
ncbi:MAG: chromosomal replication initiator protein DnaA [Acidimicrobiales bacterium]